MVRLEHKRKVTETKTIWDVVDVEPVIPIEKIFWITYERLLEFYPRDPIVGPEESHWGRIYSYDYIFTSKEEAEKAREQIYETRIKQGWKKDYYGSLERRVGDTEYSIVSEVEEIHGALISEAGGK